MMYVWYLSRRFFTHYTRCIPHTTHTPHPPACDMYPILSYPPTTTPIGGTLFRNTHALIPNRKPPLPPFPTSIQVTSPNPFPMPAAIVRPLEPHPVVPRLRRRKKVEATLCTLRLAPSHPRRAKSTRSTQKIVELYDHKGIVVKRAKAGIRLRGQRTGICPCLQP